MTSSSCTPTPSNPAGKAKPPDTTVSPPTCKSTYATSAQTPRLEGHPVGMIDTDYEAG
jgi:hypothetical protein